MVDGSVNVQRQWVTKEKGLPRRGAALKKRQRFQPEIGTIRPLSWAVGTHPRGHPSRRQRSACTPTHGRADE